MSTSEGIVPVPGFPIRQLKVLRDTDSKVGLTNLIIGGVLTSVVISELLLQCIPQAHFASGVRTQHHVLPP